MILWNRDNVTKQTRVVAFRLLGRMWTGLWIVSVLSLSVLLSVSQRQHNDLMQTRLAEQAYILQVAAQ